MPPKPKKEDNISADKRQPPNEEVPRKEGEAELNGKPPEESRHGAGLASDHTDRELALRESRRRRFAAAVVVRRVAAAVAALPPGRARSFVSAGLCCLGRPGPPSPECANRFRVMTGAEDLRWTTASRGGTRGCATLRSPDFLIGRLGNLGAGFYQSATYGAGLGGGVVHFAPRFPRLRDSDVQLPGCVTLATSLVL